MNFNYLILCIGLFCFNNTATANNVDSLPMYQKKVRKFTCPNYTSKQVKILWQQPIHKDTLYASSIIPQLIDGQVIYSDLFADQYENLKAFDARTGEIRWQSPDFNKALQGIGSTGGKIHNGEDLFISFFLDLYRIDGKSGALKWHYQFESGGPRNTLINDKMYYTKRLKKGKATTTAQLLSTSLDHPDWQIVFERKVDEGFEPDFEMPVLYQSVEGDSLLIFQNRQWNFKLNQGKVDIIAYNLNKKQIEWETKSITPDGSSTIYLLTINQGKIYFQGGSSLHCLDAETGKSLWSRTVPKESFFSGAGLIAEGKWILNGDSRALYAFDLETGEQHWKNEDAGSTVPSMATYKGHVYFGSKGTGKLYKIRLSDGQKVFAINPPNRICTSAAAFTIHVSIDQETGYLYTHDRFFAICIDLNEF